MTLMIGGFKKVLKVFWLSGAAVLKEINLLGWNCYRTQTATDDGDVWWKENVSSCRRVGDPETQL